MTVQIAMFLLTITAAMTSLITEAVKKTVKTDKPTIVAAIVSVITGIGVPIGYLILNHMAITAQDIVYIVAMVVLTWLCATLGYDKIIEVISQIVKGEAK